MEKQDKMFTKDDVEVMEQIITSLKKNKKLTKIELFAVQWIQFKLFAKAMGHIGNSKYLQDWVDRTFEAIEKEKEKKNDGNIPDEV